MQLLLVGEGLTIVRSALSVFSDKDHSFANVGSDLWKSVCIQMESFGAINVRVQVEREFFGITLFIDSLWDDDAFFDAANCVMIRVRFPQGKPSARRNQCLLITGGAAQGEALRPGHVDRD